MEEVHDNSFVNLPVEILIKIFEYLPTYYLSRTIPLVCKRFARVLSDDRLWRSLFTRQILSNTTENIEIIHPFNISLNEKRWCSGREILWRDTAVQLDIMEHKWKKYNSEIISTTYSEPHYAPVDAVKIIGNSDVIVSGGRDREVNLWCVDLSNLELKKVHSVDRGHDGWVWDIDAYETDAFFTCGWDNDVSHWSVSSSLNKLSTFSCEKPVTALSCTRGLVAAGLYIPRIVLIDPRIGLVQQMAAETSISFNIHRQAITDVLLVPHKNLLLSVSEDKMLSFFDIRHLRQSYNKLEISRGNSFPLCLGYHSDLVYIGDSRGNLHIYYLDEGIPEIQVFNIGTQSRLVTSVVPQVGGITVGSTDCHIRIIFPSNPPVLLWERKIPGQVTSVDHDKNLLAASSADNRIVLFKPVTI